MGDDRVPEFRQEDLQFALMAVIDAWWEHDRAALAALSPEERLVQREARRQLWLLVDNYRESAKRHDDQAVYHAAEWQVVAGMKDLLEHMWGAAVEACEADGTED